MFLETGPPSSHCTQEAVKEREGLGGSWVTREVGKFGIRWLSGSDIECVTAFNSYRLSVLTLVRVRKRHSQADVEGSATGATRRAFSNLAHVEELPDVGRDECTSGAVETVIWTDMSRTTRIEGGVSILRD